MERPPNRLRQLRRFYNMSPAELGDKLDKSRATIHNWETGDHDIPDWAKEALSDIFGVSIAHLMGWEDGEE